MKKIVLGLTSLNFFLFANCLFAIHNPDRNSIRINSPETQFANLFSIADSITSCSPSIADTCISPFTQITVGNQTGQNTISEWPAPFGNWYANAKHQFLFTAAELNAMGFMGGKITQIAWEVTQINGISTYMNYGISMKCTQTTSLTAFETGLTQVLAPANYTITVGWNNLNLTTAYGWDGVSNLVIEICYNWIAQYNYSQNSITPWTTTSFMSSLYYFSDGTVACPSMPTTGNSTNRPITRFGWCSTSSVSVNELENNYTFELFPNPTNTNLTTLRFDVAKASQGVEVTILNQLGQQVKSVFNGAVSNGTNSIQIETSALPKGIYFVKIKLENQSFTKKLIVQ